MSLQRILLTNRNDEAQSSLGNLNDRAPTYTSNITTAPTHDLPGRDSEYSFTDTLGVAELATPNYIYYRIYAEDGAIPSKTPFAPGDPFLGRIKAISVPPPHTAKNINRSIAKVECIKDPTSTILFLTPYSQSPMADADKVAILNRTGSGSTPQEPLALVVKMSHSERRALESEGRGGLASTAEPDTMTSEIRYLYYLLYANDYEMASKVAIDPERPSLGRIRVDSVAPPHSPASMKRCISRVERTPELAHADLFAGISSDTPLKEGHISFLRTDGPGVSPNEPMAVVQMPIVRRPVVRLPIVRRPVVRMPIVQVESPPFPDGKYFIKNRAGNFYWIAEDRNWTLKTVRFWPTEMKYAKNPNYSKWDITHDSNGNISMQSLGAPFSWVGDAFSVSTVPIPWRLIPADSNFYYLTTEMNRVSRNPRVATARSPFFISSNVSGLMDTLSEGDKWQMWEFIHI